MTIMVKGQIIDLDSTERDSTAQRIVEHGREAWSEIHKATTWDQWKKIGFAIDQGRGEAMRLLNVNQPRDAGVTWAKAWGPWLEFNGFGALDAPTQKRLLDCLDNFTEIDAWLTSLDEKERIRYNHPCTILRQWRKATSKQLPPEPKPTAQETIIAQDQEVAQLQRQLDDVKFELSEAKRELETFLNNKPLAAESAVTLAQWLKNTSPEDIAAQLFDTDQKVADEVFVALRMLRQKARLDNPYP